MSFTQTQRELHELCGRSVFMSAEQIEAFSSRLKAEGNLASLVFALEKFRPAACPKCKAEGAYKWQFLGKLTHPECNKSWYVDPGTYIGSQLKAVFRTGAEIGGGMASDAEKKGEKGYFEMFFGFVMGMMIRLPFALMMIPVQAVVSLSQSKD